MNKYLCRILVRLGLRSKVQLGTLVKVRGDLQEGKRYGKLTYFSGMDKDVWIRVIGKTRNAIQGTNQYWYTFEMLERVNGKLDVKGGRHRGNKTRYIKTREGDYII